MPIRSLHDLHAAYLAAGPGGTDQRGCLFLPDQRFSYRRRRFWLAAAGWPGAVSRARPVRLYPGTKRNPVSASCRFHRIAFRLASRQSRRCCVYDYLGRLTRLGIRRSWPVLATRHALLVAFSLLSSVRSVGPV